MSYQEFSSKVASYGNGVKNDINSLQNNWDNLVLLQGDFKKYNISFIKTEKAVT